MKPILRVPFGTFSGPSRVTGIPLDAGLWLQPFRTPTERGAWALNTRAEALIVQLRAVGAAETHTLTLPPGVCVTTPLPSLDGPIEVQPGPDGPTWVIGASCPMTFSGLALVESLNGLWRCPVALLLDQPSARGTATLRALGPAAHPLFEMTPASLPGVSPCEVVWLGPDRSDGARLRLELPSGAPPLVSLSLRGSTPNGQTAVVWALPTDPSALGQRS